MGTKTSGQTTLLPYSQQPVSLQPCTAAGQQPSNSQTIRQALPHMQQPSCATPHTCSCTLWLTFVLRRAGGGGSGTTSRGVLAPLLLATSDKVRRKPGKSGGCSGMPDGCCCCCWGPVAPLLPAICLSQEEEAATEAKAEEKGPAV